MNDQFDLLIVAILGSIVLGLGIGHLLTKRKFELGMIKAGAAYWTLDVHGHKQLKIINGKELQGMILQIVYKKQWEQSGSKE